MADEVGNCQALNRSELHGALSLAHALVASSLAVPERILRIALIAFDENHAAIVALHSVRTNVSFALSMPPVQLRRLDCTDPGRGPWKVVPDLRNRAVLVKNARSGYAHKVYYGTRTNRTLEDAEIQAIALCAVLNALKAKRP